MTDSKKSPVHVIDQSGQPYGSTRTCCNRCGLMHTPEMVYVGSIAAWKMLPDGMRCDR